MKQKLLFFFLTAFLSLIGGGNLFAADETFSVGDTESSPQTINGTKWDPEDVTLSSATASVALTIGGGSNNWTLASDKITGRNSSAFLTFQADKNGLLVINLTKNSGGNKYLTIKRNSSGQAVKSVVVNNNTTISYNSSKQGYNIEPASCPIKVSIDAEAGVSYTIDFSASDFSNWSFSSFTFDLETIDNIYSSTYPYTWNFNVETAKWSKSITQLTGLSWTKTEGESQGEAYPSTRPYDSTYEIDIIKGLVFTTGSGYPERLKLDWYNKKLVLNGYVTIPNVSVGQTITFTSDGNVTANEFGTGRVSGGTGKVFTVTTAGNVQFTVNTSISSIAVTKGDIGNFRLEGKQGYKYDELSERTSVYTFPYKAPETYTYNFKVSNGADDNEIGLLYDATENPGGIEVNSTNFTLSSDNTDVITVSGFSQATDGSKLRRIKWNDVTFGKPGEATVTFTFNGNDQFDSKTFTQKFTITKLEQVLTFAEESKSVNYVADRTSTPQTAQKVVKQKYADGYRTNVTSTYPGTDVTYSSSNTNVATVNATSGEITIKSAGETTITATAAETDIYESATASYILTVNGTQNPTIAWNASSDLTQSGDIWTAKDLPYGNHKKYTAYVSDADESGVTNSDIRYGLVEGSEGYLTIDTNTGQINPTRKFADEDLTEKVVEVYAYIPAGGSHNAAPRITYQVKIVKGTFSDDLFKENELNVNVGHTIAPKNNLQSMRWEDIDAITVTLKAGSGATAVPGTGESTVTDYKTATSKATYFDTKTATSGNDKGKEIVDWFYPIFKGLAVGTVTYTVTMSSSLYGDLSGDITLHVLEEGATTEFAWASATRKYTIYEGDYMFLPEITGNTNGNFSYSSGYDNQNTHHKYVYTRRWDGSQYVTTYNNKNFHKGEGFPNFDLTSDAEGNTAVTEVQADGSNVALLFWNTGSGTENDRLLIYGNKAGTVYLKAFDPQITTRALDLIEIEVKSKTAIDADFESLKSSMTFPYTWDFTTNYDWSAEIETGTGNWTLNGSNYDLGMSSNFNYDYADEDKDGIVWGNDNNVPNTNASELTDKLLVGKDDKVLRGFAGMKIRLGNNGTGSWYSKRDGIHILPYTDSNTPRLRVTTGTHTLILPTPTGANCPATFKVFVKAKALAAGEGTLWVRNANLGRAETGQNSYHDFKSASVGDDIIYSVDATKDTPLELDLDKVDIYWIAYSTEAKELSYFAASNPNLTYAAAAYSYNEDLDLTKSNEVNGATAYYASSFTVDKDTQGDYSDTDATDYAVVMKPLKNLGNYVKANTGMLLKYDEVGGITADTKIPFYMIANPRNVATYKADPTIDGTTHKNYLVGTGATTPTIGRTTKIGETTYTNFMMSAAYKYYADVTDPTSVQGGYHFDRDWSFYPVMSTGAMAAQKSYLQIPGDLYVNRNGEIVVMPTSARAAFDVESAADDTAEAPATKAALSIVFDDSVPATPEDPATEEPEDEDGDSVIDKDRPRKPGDDGWPKPPFPPFPPIITDIDSVNTETTDNAVWHSMEGVRISQPTKPGLYIRNGKKIVIK